MISCVFFFYINVLSFQKVVIFQKNYTNFSNVNNIQFELKILEYLKKKLRLEKSK